MNLGVKALAVATVAVFIGSTAFAAGVGDPVKGEKVFKKCKACHKVGAKAKNAFGPVLNNVVGRQAGAFAGYKYSKSMKAAGAAGLVWDEQTIPEFIENPSKFLKKYLGNKSAKSKMPLKLKKESDRENVLAYLETLTTGN